MISTVWQGGHNMEAIKACFSPGATGLLSPLQDFLEDEHVSEILLNKPQEVFIE
ncbi:TPA: P-type DNA transfer ATPase VirB11, partial [Legionella pneumophila subsp. pneumophila]